MGRNSQGIGGTSGGNTNGSAIAESRNGSKRQRWARCAAKTRKGHPCRAAGAGIGGRCLLHGGLTYPRWTRPPEPFLLFEVDGSRWLAVPEGLADAVPGKLTLASVQDCSKLGGRAWPQALGFRIVKRLSQAGRIARVEVSGQRNGRAWLTAEEFGARMGNSGRPRGICAEGNTLLMTGNRMYAATSKGHSVVDPQPVSKRAAVALVARGQVETGIIGAQVGQKMLNSIEAEGVKITRRGAQAPGAERVLFEPIGQEPTE